ncbi:MAG: hypothetical protein KC589_04540, partial [Nanoarchaeota archaeon]|nr:hypothetical protein [Nanoarchaeota archaeon]
FSFFLNNSWNNSLIGNTWLISNLTGFSQTCNDTSPVNGLCDTSYNITTGNVDYLAVYVPNSTVKYMFPSPSNNSHYGGEVITIKISDLALSVFWANISFNNNSYDLSNNWDGSWQVSIDDLPLGIQNISYQVFYNDGELGEVTFTYYPDYSGTTYPAYSFLAGLLSILFLSFGFFLRKTEKDRRGVTAIISLLLLLIVAVVGSYSLFVWQENFRISYQEKQNQALSIGSNGFVNIEGIKNESSVINLYIKNNNRGYIILDEVKMNNQNCNLTKSNVLRGLSMNKIEIDCSLYLELNDVVLSSKLGLVSDKKILSN